MKLIQKDRRFFGEVRLIVCKFYFFLLFLLFFFFLRMQSVCIVFLWRFFDSSLKYSEYFCAFFLFCNSILSRCENSCYFFWSLFLRFFLLFFFYFESGFCFCWNCFFLCLNRERSFCHFCFFYDWSRSAQSFWFSYWQCF